MNIPERINRSISRRSGETVCDNCLAIELDLDRQTVNRAAIVLGTTTDFDRFRDRCSECGTRKLVIRVAAN